ncbi:MAG: hypothetical protein K2Y39_18155 [Candidatus Obscuribacterales bacterium]|nr:hypothetical protein [Candidatus Obscuribacterales bacterium]
MNNKNTILEGSQSMSVVVTIVLFAFTYGVFVGYSGKMLYLDSKNIPEKDTVNGRFGQVVKTL